MRFDHTASQAHFASFDVSDSPRDDDDVWHGQIENCDICSRPMGLETYMIDGPCQAAPMPMWGNLCVVCAYPTCPVIGWGKAQLYKRRGTQWALVAGGMPLDADH